MAITRPIETGTTFRTIVYTGRKGEAPYTDLSEGEIAAINICLDTGFEHLGMVSPKLTSIYQAQRADILTWAGFAKAAMDNKVIGYPSRPGGIGVCWLNPWSIHPNTAEILDMSEVIGWKEDSYELKELKEGTIHYLFGSYAGDETCGEYYKSYDQQPRRAMSIVMKDGLVEIGTTPSFSLHQIISESDTQYGVVNESPLNMLPVEQGLGVYLHKTIGMVPLWSDLGIKWSILPIRDGTPVVVPIGVTFYEHGYFSGLDSRGTQPTP